MSDMAKRISACLWVITLVSCSATDVRKTAEFCQALTPVMRAMVECAR